MSRFPNPLDKPLLTVIETAELLGISPSTAYRRISDGSLPVVRLGTRTTRVPTGALVSILSIGQHPTSEHQPSGEGLHRDG